MKILLSISFLLLTAVFPAKVFPQYCGGSIRTIRLEYPAGVTPARSVNYQLYFLMPKDESYREWKKLDTFIATFLGKKPDETISWKRNGNTTFLSVPAKKAEAYINAYKSEDFKHLFTLGRYELFEDQYTGKFDDGKLELRTGETNDHTFMMQVSAKGFETQYLLSNFLGGCFPRYTRPGDIVGQKIEMRSLTKRKN